MMPNLSVNRTARELPCFALRRPFTSNVERQFFDLSSDSKGAILLKNSGAISLGNDSW
jgi:hypothetical protein